MLIFPFQQEDAMNDRTAIILGASAPVATSTAWRTICAATLLAKIIALTVSLLTRQLMRE